MSSDGVTIRKPRKVKSFTNLTMEDASIDDSTDLFETTILSMPSTTINDSHCDDLIGKVSKLTQELETAHREIENLNLENSQLKSELEDCRRIIRNYKKVTVDERSITTPSSAKRKNSLQTSSLTSTPLKVAPCTSHSDLLSNNLKLPIAKPLQTSSSSSTPMKRKNRIQSNQLNNAKLSKNLKTKVRDTKSEPLIPKKKVKTIQHDTLSSTPVTSVTPEILNATLQTGNNHNENEIQLEPQKDVVTGVDKDLEKDEVLNTPDSPKEEQSQPKAEERQTSSTYNNGHHENKSTRANIQEAKITEHTTASFSETVSKKHNVLIVSDQQGRYVQNLLQSLLGSEYKVTSIRKPGACTSEILKLNSNYQTMTKNDYIIILTGVNDRNPFEFETSVHLFIRSLVNTNILVYKVPHNKCLNVTKLNYVLKFICKNYESATFIDVDYSRFVPYNEFVLSQCQHLLQDILRINYRTNFINYQNYIKNKNNKIMIDKFTQTDNGLKFNEDVQLLGELFINTTTHTSTGGGEFFRS